jgi:subtilisin family serine protease
VALLLALAPALARPAAELVVDLPGLIEHARRTASIPVIIQLDTALDLEALRGQVSALGADAGAGFEARRQRQRLLRQQMVADLKAQARDRQQALVALLRRQGVRAPITALWGINALATDLPARLIDTVAAQPGVVRISVDMPLSLNAVAAPPVTAEPRWNLQDLRVEHVWDQGFWGDGVVVAIMDSGVDVNHPDLAGRWRGATGGWFDPYGQYAFPVDADGHGTQALSLILGGDASGYTIGLAPGARWIAARLFDDQGRSSLSAIHQAFQWLLDPDGNPATDDVPDVVNNSWGFSNTINQCYQEFADDIRLLREAGVSVVFSAGNYGPLSESSISPANNPGVTSVGSVDQFQDIDTFSSRGPGACDGGVFPKLVAPGSLVYVADRLPTAYNVVSGTSFAAPHVAGAIALLKSAYPMATVSQIETALYDSADDLAAPGADSDTGYGRINVAAAYDHLYRELGSSSAGMLVFSESGYSVDETTDRLVVTVRRLGGSAGAVSVDYETLADQARDTGARDFERTSGTLHFSDGQTLKTFQVRIFDDSLDEDNETFHVRLSHPTGDALLSSQPQVPVVILDDDGPGSFAFDALSYAVNEAHDHATVTLVRSAGKAGPATVRLSLAEGSARQDADYLLPEALTVRFEDGQVSAQVEIPLVDDSVHEGNESFRVSLGEPTHGARIVEPAAATVTILDDDPDNSLTTVHFDAVNYLVSERGQSARLTVRRSGNLDRTASVSYRTVAGSARAGTDFLASSGLLVFRPRVSSKTLSVPILDDAVYERERSFTVVLSEVDAGSVLGRPDAAIVRIADDDAQSHGALSSAGNGLGGGSGAGARADDGGVGGIGGTGESDAGAPAEPAAAGAGSGVKIFDLDLRGYAGVDPKDVRRFQALVEQLQREADAPPANPAEGAGLEAPEPPAEGPAGCAPAGAGEAPRECLEMEAAAPSDGEAEAVAEPDKMRPDGTAQRP